MVKDVVVGEAGGPIENRVFAEAGVPGATGIFAKIGVAPGYAAGGGGLDVWWCKITGQARNGKIGQ